MAPRNNAHPLFSFWVVQQSYPIRPSPSAIYHILGFNPVFLLGYRISEGNSSNLASRVLHEIDKLSPVESTRWLKALGHAEAIANCGSEQCSEQQSSIVKRAILVDNSHRVLRVHVGEDLSQF